MIDEPRRRCLLQNIYRPFTVLVDTGPFTTCVSCLAVTL